MATKKQNTEAQITNTTNVIPFKHYEPTYVVFAKQMIAGIEKEGWELYDSKAVWRITDLKAVVDKLYSMGDQNLLAAAHLKTPSYIQYHYGKRAKEVAEILKTTPITDRAAIEAQGLRAEHLLMVNARIAHDIIHAVDPKNAAKWFKYDSQKLARQCK